LTGEDTQRVQRLEQQITNLRRAGKFADGCGPARAIVDLRRRVQGETHWQTQDARRLLELLEKVAALPAKAQAELAEAEKLDADGHKLLERERNAEAIPQFRRALDLRRRHLGEQHFEVATAENHLAASLDLVGKHTAAEPLHRRALAINQKVLGEDHPFTALCYDHVARNLDDQGRFAAAEPLYRRALAIHLKVLGEDHPDTAQSLNSVASNLDVQGKYALAEPLFRRALTLRQKALGEDHPDTTLSYDNLAHSLYAQGRYAEAELLVRRALLLRLTALGEDDPDTALSHNSLAMILDAQGKYAEAEPLFRRALALHQKVLGEDHPATATVYDNLARNLRTQGRHAEAEPLFCRALALRLKALGEGHPYTAQSYLNLAANLNDLGKYAEAERLLRRALAVCLKTLGEDHPATAAVCNNLAVSLGAQGRFAEAEPLARRALTVCLKTLGEEHPHKAQSYTNLALNLYAQGKYAVAEATWAQAVQSYDIARLRSSPTGLDRAAFEGAPLIWPARPACQARLGQPLSAWRSLEAGLARGLLDDFSTRLTSELSPAERQRQQGLNVALDRLDRQVTALLLANQPSEADRARLREAAHERQAAQAELAHLAADLAARQVYDRRRIQEQLAPDAAWIAWVDLKGEPKAVNPSGEHWACVLRHQGDPAWVRLPGAGSGGAWTEDDNDLVGRFRLAVSASPGHSREDQEALTRQVAAQRLAPLEPALRATADLPAVKHLLVCPVWQMAGVPVETLTDQYVVSYVPSGTLFARLQELRRAKGPAGTGSTLFALGDPAFRKRPAEKEDVLPESGVLITALVPRGNADRSGLQPGDVLLAYGDKKVSGPADLRPAAPLAAKEVTVQVWRHGQLLQRKVQPGPLGVRIAPQPAPVALRQQRDTRRVLRASTGPYYPRLPSTRMEVRTIASFFDQPLVLLDSAASAGRLAALVRKDELRRFRYLHFATHGTVNDRVALQSALILAPDPRPAGLGPTSASLPESGGHLTAAQMLQWKLDAELVTLSACQSGLGKQAGGEGYLGFAQALFLAGARSVLVSLWKVDDTATALLMARFYQNLLGKRPGLKAPLPKAEALHEAKLWLRDLTAVEVEALQNELRAGQFGAGPAAKRQVDADAERPYAHPHYWAAFILFGDPQ
jgi:tetratricopeptide (TPR) repeat protein